MASKTRTPSKGITAGQIGQIQDRIGTALRKSGFQADLVQQVLSTKGQGDLMIAEMAAVARKFVKTWEKARNNEIVRRVKVDRSLDPQEMLDDLDGYQSTTDKCAVATIPQGRGEEVDIVFFKPEPCEYTRPGCMSDDDLEKALERRGLTPDPRAQIVANKADPSLADECPNGTNWKDTKGKWYFLMFSRRATRAVIVSCSDNSSDWGGGWWFAGVRM